MNDSSTKAKEKEVTDPFSQGYAAMYSAPKHYLRSIISALMYPRPRYPPLLPPSSFISQFTSTCCPIAQPDDRNVLGFSDSHAILADRMRAIQLTFEQLKKDVGARDYRGYTPLHMMAACKTPTPKLFSNLVEKLLQEPGIESVECVYSLSGHSPASLALQWGHVDLGVLLCRRFAPRDYEYETLSGLSLYESLFGCSPLPSIDTLLPLVSKMSPCYARRCLKSFCASLLLTSNKTLSLEGIRSIIQELLSRLESERQISDALCEAIYHFVRNGCIDIVFAISSISTKNGYTLDGGALASAMTSMELFRQRHNMQPMPGVHRRLRQLYKQHGGGGKSEQKPNDTSSPTIPPGSQNQSLAFISLLERAAYQRYYAFITGSVPDEDASDPQTPMGEAQKKKENVLQEEAETTVVSGAPSKRTPETTKNTRASPYRKHNPQVSTFLHSFAFGNWKALLSVFSGAGPQESTTTPSPSVSMISEGELDLLVSLALDGLPMRLPLLSPVTSQRLSSAQIETFFQTFGLTACPILQRIMIFHTIAQPAHCGMCSWSTILKEYESLLCFLPLELIVHLDTDNVGDEARKTNPLSPDVQGVFKSKGKEEEQGQFLRAVLEHITARSAICDKSGLVNQKKLQEDQTSECKAPPEGHTSEDKASPPSQSLFDVERITQQLHNILCFKTFHHQPLKDVHSTGPDPQWALSIEMYMGLRGAPSFTPEERDNNEEGEEDSRVMVKGYTRRFQAPLVQNIVFDSNRVSDLDVLLKLVFEVLKKNELLQPRTRGCAVASTFTFILHRISPPQRWALTRNRDVLAMLFKVMGHVRSSCSSCAMLGTPEVILDALGNDGQFSLPPISSERNIVLSAVRSCRGPEVLRNASTEFRNDREIVLAAVENDGGALKYASDSLRNDSDVVLVAVEKNEEALLDASSSLRHDCAFMTSAVEKNALCLQYALTPMKNNRAIVLAAIAGSWVALKYASATLKNDQDVVLTAVSKNGYALQFASPALRNKRDFVLRLVEESYFALQYAPDTLKDDAEVVLAAVSNSGAALEYASERLRSDRKFVLDAIGISGSALQYASSALKGDRTFILDAVSKNGGALQSASDAEKNDSEIVLAAVKTDAWALRDASDALRGDRLFVLKAVSLCGSAIEYVSDALRSDRGVVLAAVATTGPALQHVPDALKADREIVLAAVKQTGRALEYASETLKSDREVVLAALSNDKSALEFASDTLKNDAEIVGKS